jgi:hypothetical protein
LSVDAFQLSDTDVCVLAGKAIPPGTDGGCVSTGGVSQELVDVVPVASPRFETLPAAS